MLKTEERASLSVFKIAATYIGTVVGAGFASGQEVLQFFGLFGINGLWGLLLATSLFALFGWAVLDLGMRLNARSHLEVIYFAGGKWLGRLIDYVITFFLFGALTAMVAGAGAIFAEQFGWPALLGSVIMVFLTVITVMMGLNGVINSISFVVPVLLGAVVGIGVWTIVTSGFFTNPVIGTVPMKAPVPFWPFSAIIYVSYNLVMSVAILAPLGTKYRRPELLKRGALLGGIGLGLGALAIFAALAPNLPQASRFQIPMIFIASKLTPTLTIVYSLVLLAEIYTTAVGNLYGFVSRISSADTVYVKYYIIGTALMALAASQFGFTTLVRFLYPAVGYAGLALLLGLAYAMIKKNKGQKSRPDG